MNLNVEVRLWPTHLQEQNWTKNKNWILKILTIWLQLYDSLKGSGLKMQICIRIKLLWCDALLVNRQQLTKTFLAPHPLTPTLHHPTIVSSVWCQVVRSGVYWAFSSYLCSHPANCMGKFTNGPLRKTKITLLSIWDVSVTFTFLNEGILSTA